MRHLGRGVGAVFEQVTSNLQRFDLGKSCSPRHKGKSRRAKCRQVRRKVRALRKCLPSRRHLVRPAYLDVSDIEQTGARTGAMKRTPALRRLPSLVDINLARLDINLHLQSQAHSESGILRNTTGNDDAPCRGSRARRHRGAGMPSRGRWTGS
jgi:hypothetical protein